MTEDVFAELDGAVGPVALMSLQNRGLLPSAGTQADEALPERDVLLDRVTGALLGAAVGSALGRLAEKKQRRAGAAQFVDADELARKRLTGPSGKVRAGVQQLLISADALLSHGVGAAPLVSDRLVSRVRSLRVPGRAVVATVDQRRAGVPWFEAGAGSFGEGALCRAVAAGLIFANDPVRRPVIAGLDAAVTHASQKAVEASGSSRMRSPRSCVGWPPRRAASSTTRCWPRFRSIRRPSRPLPPRSRSPGHSPVTLCVRSPRPLRCPATPTRSQRSRARSRAQPAVRARCLTGGSLSVELAAELRALAARIVAHLMNDPEDGSHIWFLLDRSGSMQSIAGAVVEGCNAFFAEQRAVSGAARLTFVQFDTEAPNEVLLDDCRSRVRRPVASARVRPSRGHSAPRRDGVAPRSSRSPWRSADRQPRRRVHGRRGELEPRVDPQPSVQAHRRAPATEAGRSSSSGRTRTATPRRGSLGIASGSTSNFRPTPSNVASAYVGLSRATREWRGKAAQMRMVDKERFWGDRKEAEEDEA